MKQELQGLVCFAELPIVRLLIGSDNIVNIEDNNGPFAKRIIIVHNLVTQNRNRLKFWN